MSAKPVGLESKTLTELRSIAQSVGIIPDYAIGKDAILQQIRGHVSARVQQPEKPIQVNITTGDRPTVTPQEVTKALEGFKELGLVVTFPDERTWQMHCNLKNDTGTMHMPMWNIIQVARELVRP